MSGHNKWSKIKHKKAATDAKKSKIFSKYSKLISVEAKKANGNLDSPGLKSVIDRAKKENMPLDNIEKAVKKATDPDMEAMKEVMFEAYGPGGSALIITGLTDNNNRTAAEVKTALSKNGGSLAAQGAASWAFTRQDDGRWVANDPMDLDDDKTEKVINLVEILEDNDDVQNIFTNLLGDTDEE